MPAGGHTHSTPPRKGAIFGAQQGKILERRYLKEALNPPLSPACLRPALSLGFWLGSPRGHHETSLHMQVVWKEMRQPENGEMRLARKRKSSYLMNLFAGQEERHRPREQTCAHSGEGRGAADMRALRRVLSSTAAQKRQALGAQPSLWSNSHTHM